MRRNKKFAAIKVFELDYGLGAGEEETAYFDNEVECMRRAAGEYQTCSKVCVLSFSDVLAENVCMI